jgi:hypothetical protein
VKISDADLGWMAAIIDMKGGVITKANKTRKTPQVILKVDTVQRPIAERLCALTGVSPEPHKLSDRSAVFYRRGCKEHCLEPHIHVEEDNLPMYSTRWTVTGTAMGIVIWNLRKHMTTYPNYSPYMGLVFSNTTVKGQGVGMVRASVKRLKDLGWRIPAKIERELAFSES